MLTAALLSPASPAAPATQPAVRIILDTDMDSDCDDPGALGMLHAMADRGECEILAVMVSAKNPWSAPCTDAINTYYGRPDLPIGNVKGPGVNTPSKYAKPIAEAFPHDLKSGDAAPDAAELYREVLAKQPDGSVVIVTIGDMTNLRNLLRLEARGDLPAGKEIVRVKVKQWVCMGGNFIGKPAKDDLKLGNNNFTLDAKATHEAIRGWPGPIMFVGREIGSVPSGLKAGAKLRETPMSNPVRMAYRHYFDGTEKDRHVADQTTVLYAVRGLADYWDAETKGHMDLKPDMTFEWRYDTDKGQGYLLKRKAADGKPNDRMIEQVIDELMTQPPRKRA